MTDTTAETLRKIVALCQPIDYAESLDETSGSAALEENQNHILARGRYVLRERGVDVRWNNGKGTRPGGRWRDTEAEAILKALEATQPKPEKRDKLFCQLAAITKDRDELAAAIATPEVYAGVVTRVLEIDRGKLLKQLRVVTDQRDRAMDDIRTTIIRLDNGGWPCVDGERDTELEQFLKAIVHQLETVKSNELYDMTAWRDRAVEACRHVFNNAKYTRSHDAYVVSCSYVDECEAIVAEADKEKNHANP